MRAAGLAVVLLVACGPAREVPRPGVKSELPAAGAATGQPVTATPPAVDAGATPPGAALYANAAAAVDCLRRPGAAAVLRLLSSTPDCSGIGHRHLVFEVLVAAKPTGLRRAYLSCPLYGRCPALAGELSKAGAVAVANLTPDARPARTLFCVPLPATDASVECTAEVASEAAARRLLADFRP